MMELRTYFGIVRRFWWLLLALPLSVGLLSVVSYQEPPVIYGYDIKFSISFLPLPRENMDQDPRLGAVQASEYVADDLTEVIRGTLFTSMVQSYMPENQQLPPNAIVAATRAEKRHRILIVNITANSAEQADAIGGAVVEAAQSELGTLMADLWGTEARMLLIDEVGPTPLPRQLRSRLDVPLRVLVALVAAVALAFALDYFDDSVRSRTEAEQLAGPVLAEIPSK